VDTLVVPPDISSPYVGLIPYDEAHRCFFFGRELDADVITDNILNRKLTILYGTSGVGKSSLLNVGLPKALAARGSEATLIVRNEWHDPPAAIKWLYSIAPASGGKLPEKVLVFDQFEEFFYYSREPTEIAPAIVEVIRGGHHVLLCVREDSLYLLDALRLQLPTLFDTILELQHLGYDAVKEAIDNPVREWSRRVRPVVIDGDFADTLIRQLSDAKHIEDAHVELSYLQLALQKIWDAEGGADATALRTATLMTKLQGVQRIANEHVNQVLASLSPEQKEICARVLDRLVPVSGQKVAYTIGDLAPFANATPEQLTRALDPLTVDPNRILRKVTMRGAAQPQGYEIIHAILSKPIFDWTQQRAKHEYARKAADQEALRVTKLHARKTKIALAITASISVLLLAAIIAAIYFYRLAVSQQLAARSAAEFYLGNTDRALLLGVGAENVADDADARGSLLRVMENVRGIAGFLPPSPYRVDAVAFSPDGKSLATGDDHGTVRLWDTATRQPVSVPLAHIDAPIQMLTFMQDGAILQVDYTDGRVSRLALDHPSIPRDYGTATNDLRDYSADGSTVVAWSSVGIVLDSLYDRNVRNISVADLMGKGDPKSAAVSSAAINADGTMVAVAISLQADSAPLRTRIRILNTATLQPLLSRDVMRRPVALKFSPDGSALALTTTQLSTNVQTEVWATNGDLTWAIRGSHAQINTLVFSADSQELLVGSSDNLMLWDFKQSRRVWVPIQKDAAAPVSAAMSPDGTLIASSTPDKRVIVWDTNNNRDQLHFVLGHEQAGISSVAFEPDGKAVAVRTLDGQVSLYTVPAGKRTVVTTHASIDNGGTAFSFDGQFLAYGGEDGQLVIHGSDGQERIIPTLSKAVPPVSVSGLAFARKSNRLAWATSDGALRIVDAASGAVTNLGGDTCQVGRWPAGPCPKWSLAFGQNDSILVAGRVDGGVSLWTLATPQAKPKSIPGPSSSFVTSVSFNPDGTELVAGKWDKSIAVWDVPNQPKQSEWHERAPLNDHLQTVSTVAFSPDGTILASGSWDTRVILWDAERNARLGDPLVGHQATVNSVSFSPDGHSLVSGSQDGELILWAVNVDDWKRSACKIANRNLQTAEWAPYIRIRVQGMDTPENLCPVVAHR
jgi:WD40 repeat protein